MRVKKLVFLITAMCLSAISAGCWDARDINNKALITLVVTDRQDDEYIFYVEVPNLAVGQAGEGGGGDTDQFSIVKSGGGTYAEARRELNATMEKPIFLGSARALVVTDELAMQGFEEYMYRMQNMLDYRKTLHIVTTREKPEDVLSTTPENNVSIGYSIDETIATLEEDKKVIAYTVSDVLEFLYADYCFVLINMDMSEGRLVDNGYTIIHKGRYLGFIPLEESIGLVWLAGDNIKRLYVVPFGRYTATVEVKTVSREITPAYSDNGVSFDISFAFNSKVQYISRNIKFDEAAEAQVKNNLQAQLLDDITAAINQSKAYRCDYMGFKERFRVAFPNIVNQLDWESEYVGAEFNISVETRLETGGMMDLEAQGRQVN